MDTPSPNPSPDDAAADSSPDSSTADGAGLLGDAGPDFTPEPERTTGGTLHYGRRALAGGDAIDAGARSPAASCGSPTACARC
jgi:hypothetical protein